MTDTEAEVQPSERAGDDAQGAVKAELAGEATDTQLQGDEAGCSSGESNTRAKRSASATTTNYKDGSPSGSRRPGSGNGSGDGGSGHGSRAGSGNEDGPTSAKPRAAAASGKAGTAGKGGKRKLARPEGTAQCPRCESSDTKFCYYNNYNIKQPRYFCKTCQRYWTAGGILRNVPVGAGRRKSKASAVREQEKAAAAVAAKQARQVAAHGGASGQAAGANGASGPGMPGGIDTGQQPQLMSAAGDLLPAGPMGGGPAPGFGADQLRFMMDPCAQLAAGGMGGPGGTMGGPSGAMMGGPGGMGPMSFDAPAGYGGGFGPGTGMMLPPHAAGGMRMGSDGGGMLPAGSGGTLGTESAVLSGPVGSGFSGGAAEDGGRADGRRVRAKLDGGHGGSMGGGHGGGIPPSNSAGSLGKGLPGGSAGGGDDRHPEWAAAAQAAERQQAAALAAQMAAQASMQQAAAMQAQAQLQGMAAAAQWGQPAAPFGMPGTGMWPSYPAMAAPSYGVSPNWAAAAQLNARFGNNGFGGNMSSSGDPSGGSGAMKSPTMAVGAPGDAAGGDMNGAPGMMGGGGWNGMMPTGSAPMNFNPGWGMGGDMGGGWGGLPGVPHMSMPAGKHMGSMSGGGGPAGSSLASGQSANTGLQAPSAAV